MKQDTRVELTEERVREIVKATVEEILQRKAEEILPFLKRLEQKKEA